MPYMMKVASASAVLTTAPLVVVLAATWATVPNFLALGSDGSVTFEGAR